MYKKIVLYILISYAFILSINAQEQAIRSPLKIYGYLAVTNIIQKTTASPLQVNLDTFLVKNGDTVSWRFLDFNAANLPLKLSNIANGDTLLALYNDTLYLIKFFESDPVWISDSGTYAAKSWVTDQGFITSESDPIWISDSGTYAAKSWVLDQGFITSESDPVWVADSSTYSAKSYVRKMVSDTSYWTKYSGELVTKSNVTNVGIGTTNPTNKLHVWAVNDAMIKLQDDDNLTSYTTIKDVSNGIFEIIKQTATGISRIDFEIKPLDGTSNAQIQFFRETNTTGSNQVIIYKGNNSAIANTVLSGNNNNYFCANNSNVGIGTSNPAEKLHVAGNIKIDTSFRISQGGYNLIRSYQDGIFVGSHNTTLSGTLTTLVGWESGNNITSASFNTGIGAHALKNTTTGYGNTAVGADAMAYNVTGHHNCAIGVDALYTNSSGYENVAVGWGALDFNTTGSSNVAIGYFALKSNTYGVNTVAIGTRCLEDVIGGTGNVGVGHNVLMDNISGNDNTALGYQAGKNIKGHGNTAIGHDSFQKNITGNYNAAIGSGSGENIIGGSNNTLIGYEAGKYSAEHTQSGCVFIGYQAGYNDTLDNHLAIDNSNTLTPLVYGDFTNDYLQINGCFTINTIDTIEDGDISGSTLTIGAFNNFVLTGSSDIDSISVDSSIPDLTTFTILFTGTASHTGINEGGNIKLSGSFAYAKDDIIVLQRFGNFFYEKCRSVND